MEQKDPKDMTVSEQLRWAANGEPYNGIDENIWTYPTGKIRALAEAVTGEWPSDNKIFSIVADKIDAELAQARGEALRQGAELWAKANGWPDFREGEDFGAWLDRCAIPRPRYDDGEPVQDADLEEIGSLATCYVYTDGSWVFDPDPYEDERNPKAWCKQCGDRDDRVKCPALEVLLGDGKPVSKGETVYVTDSGIERTVKNFGTKLFEGMDGWDGSPWVMFGNGSWMHSRDLTHTPPDTQERIDKDTRLSSVAYWKCNGIPCRICQAAIDGENPAKWYGVRTCGHAMFLDLLRRQRELDARKGGDAR